VIDVGAERSNARGRFRTSDGFGGLETLLKCICGDVPLYIDSLSRQRNPIDLGYNNSSVRPDIL